MDPIFEHPVFDSARERVKCEIRQLEKPQEAPENSLYTCFKCVEATMYFPLQNKLDLQTREHLYSTSVVIVTINGGMDDTGYTTSIQSKFKRWVYSVYSPIITITLDILDFLDMMTTLSESIDSLKMITSVYDSVP